MVFRKRYFKISLLLFLFLSSCDTPSDSPYPDILCTRLASLPGNGRSSAVGFAINGKGYVALGRDSLRNPLNDCWEYDPTENTWTQKAPFPGTARVKAMATTLNGKAYVGLGFNSLLQVYGDKKAYLTDLWMYNPIANEWTKKADFPGKSTNACVSFTYNNDIYVGSGFDGYGFLPDFWKYKPSEDSWIRLKDFPGEPRFGSVICTNGERVFFGSGYKTDNANDWWEYYPESDLWKRVKNMPEGRENAVTLSVDNRFFVSTGRFWGGNHTLGHLKSDILEYDARKDLWYNRGNVSDTGRENAISFVIDGKGYIGFGENDNAVLNDFWSFEP